MDKEGAHVIQSVGEYLESGYAPNPEQLFMDDEVYAKALDAIVLTCTDIALTKNGQMFLGKRTRHPQPDWWIVGGRMRAGETFTASATRLLKKELNLPIAPERLLQLTVFAAAWKERAFAPANNGTHTVSIVLTAEISNDEAGHIKLNDEYSDSGWMDFAAVAGNELYHPGLRQVAQALVEKSGA
jgi:ADP-ribose pyrophosphatase YjhB (NUDIX family)